jgi:putative ABC transport system permease protein
VRRIESYTDVIRRQLAQQNMMASLSWIFSAIGLALAAVGLFGLTEYRVEQQTAEIGVRMALGGNRRSIVAMVLRGALRPVAVGVALGIPAAVGVGLLMSNQLFGVTAWDPRILFVAPMLLTVATLIAAAIPARHAAVVDPLRALRSE